MLVTNVPVEQRRDLRHRLWSLSWLVVGAAVGLLVFGGLYILYSLFPGFEFRRSLTAEDGFFEWLSALGFLLAAMLQLFLFWRSDVPAGRRLLPFTRRNVFYLGVALVLLFAFAEEISWGQRVFGWQTPEFMAELNLQQETNIHNLAGLHGDSLISMTRLFNLFWLGYAVMVPITASLVPLLALLYRRISLPIVPLVIGGLFLGHFASWRVYNLLETTGRGDEIEEAFLAACWLALALAQVIQGRGGRASRAGAAPDRGRTAGSPTTAM